MWQCLSRSVRRPRGSVSPRCLQRGIHTAHPNSLGVDSVEIMSPRASESHAVNHMNITGECRLARLIRILTLSFLGGVGGVGGRHGGGGGAGQGPRISYAVEAENFTMQVILSLACQMLFLTKSSFQIHGPGREQQQRMNCEC
jgi:hypothetical protein